MSELPTKWRKVRLGDAYRFTKKPRGFSLRDYSSVPFVPMEIVPIGQEFFEDYVMKASGEISSGTYFEPGDILLAKITPSFENGKQGIIDHLPLPFGFASTEVIPIQEIDGLSDRMYLFYFLLRKDVRSELAGKMEGSTGRQRLSKSVLEELEIPLPPLSEQQAIANSLRAVKNSQNSRLREAARLDELFGALLEELMTGRIRAVEDAS